MAGVAAGRGRRSFALEYGREGDVGPDARRGRRLERKTVNGGARRINRGSWAKRRIRGVDLYRRIAGIQEHQRPACLTTNVVREECPPGL